MLRAFPMILIAVIIYNVLVFGGDVTGHDAPALLGQNFPVRVFSGDIWKISLGETLVTLTLVLLFIEIVKATRPNRRAILNHALSMLTFVGALVEFIVLKGFGTSTFFFMTILCLFDVVAGYTISIVAARRDLSMAPHDDP